MDNQNLASSVPQLKGARIDVRGAITIIDRAASRLSFLLESSFHSDSASDIGWWVSGRETYYSEKQKQQVQMEKKSAISGLWSVVSETQEDLVRVYVLIYPEQIHRWPWLVGEVENRPVCEWVGPELSCDLVAPVDCLDLLLNGALTGLNGQCLVSFSPEAFLGFKTIMEDVRKRLDQVLIELNGAVH